jgi:hypothetical protein
MVRPVLGDGPPGPRGQSAPPRGRSAPGCADCLSSLLLELHFRLALSWPIRERLQKGCLDLRKGCLNLQKVCFDLEKFVGFTKGLLKFMKRLFRYIHDLFLI